MNGADVLIWMAAFAPWSPIFVLAAFMVTKEFERRREARERSEAEARRRNGGRASRHDVIPERHNYHPGILGIIQKFSAGDYPPFRCNGSEG